MSAYHKASRVGAHHRHRFKCIEGQIEKYLEQLHAISHDTADIRINLHRDGDVLRQGIGSHDAEQVLQNFPGLDGSMSCFGPAHHVADSLDDLASAVTVCHNVGQQLTQLFGLDIAAGDQTLPGAGVCHHRANRIVYLVRE